MTPPPLGLPRLIGHRGAAAYAPENTLAGFRLARERGAAWVEFDVRLTRDGDLAVMHDDTLERTTNGAGRVLDRTMRELSALDNGGWFGAAFAGERVASLAEAIRLFDRLGLGANIEVKAKPAEAARSAEALARILAAGWPPHLPAPLVSSFEPAVLARLAAIAPQWPRGLLIDTLDRDPKAALAAVGAATLNVNHRLVTRANVADLSAGRPVLVYTVNDAVRARDLLSWGVAAIISDRPDLPATD
jgi:glycerophosphoryl diester phosphodiesterase